MSKPKPTKTPPGTKAAAKPATCGAKTRTTDDPCANRAGKGTDHVGIGKCRWHGGNTPSHNRHAIVVAAKQRMVMMGEPIDDARPADVLLGLLRASAGHVTWLYEEIREMEDLGSHESQVILEVYDQERRIAQSISESCLRAGIDEAIVKFAEQEGALLVNVLTAMMNELRLTDGQRAALGPAMEKVKPMLAGEAPDASHDAAIVEALAADYAPAEWVKPVL